MYFYYGNYCCSAYKALYFDLGMHTYTENSWFHRRLPCIQGDTGTGSLYCPDTKQILHNIILCKHFICLLKKVARNYNKINEELINCINHHLTAASLCGYWASTAQSNAGANGVATRGRTITVARAYTCDAGGSGVYTIRVLRARSV